MVHGQNTSTGTEDEVMVFYDDVSGVQVFPESKNFGIQVVTPDFAVEMDFPGPEEVREALKQFEAKRVLKVDADPIASVRITPSSESMHAFETHGEPLITLRTSMPENMPSPTEQRLGENLPDTQ